MGKGHLLKLKANLYSWWHTATHVSILQPYGGSEPRVLIHMVLSCCDFTLHMTALTIPLGSTEFVYPDLRPLLSLSIEYLWSVWLCPLPLSTNKSRWPSGVTLTIHDLWLSVRCLGHPDVLCCESWRAESDRLRNDISQDMRTLCQMWTEMHTVH